MYTLIFETSSSRGILAITRDKQVIFKNELPFGVRDSAELVPVLEMALNKTQLNFDQIDRIVIGKGPGSFTGIRIGASIAKAISFAKEIPIISVSSLKSFFPPEEGHFAVLIDAKASGIYLQKGSRQGALCSYESDYEIHPPERIQDKIESIPLLICTQKTSLETKLNFTSHQLVELSPHPQQMLFQAMQEPKESYCAGLDQIDLHYFNKAS